MAISEIRYPPMEPDDRGTIPIIRFREAKQHVLETASGLMTSAPAVSYLMSFVVRMRYSPETDSCQVVIQPHYRPSDDYEGETGEDIISLLAREIRAAIGDRISAKARGYISASSTLDKDNLADLFILYFFISGNGETPGPGALVSGVYQMNSALRTFVPEMEEIAIDALGRCLSLFRRG